MTTAASAPPILRESPPKGLWASAPKATPCGPSRSWGVKGCVETSFYSGVYLLLSSAEWQMGLDKLTGSLDTDTDSLSQGQFPPPAPCKATGSNVSPFRRTVCAVVGCLSCDFFPSSWALTLPPAAFPGRSPHGWECRWARSLGLSSLSVVSSISKQHLLY